MGASDISTYRKNRSPSSPVTPVSGGPPGRTAALPELIFLAVVIALSADAYVATVRVTLLGHTYPINPEVLRHRTRMGKRQGSAVVSRKGDYLRSYPSTSAREDTLYILLAHRRVSRHDVA